MGKESFKINTVFCSAVMRFTLAAIVFCVVLCSCGSNIDNKYIVELDDAINKNEHFVAQKEYLINELKRKFYSANDDVEAYNLAIDIYQNYQYFSLDSAFIYMDKAIALSEKLGDNDRIVNTKLSLAFLYNFSGMLSESLDIFRNISEEKLTPELKRNYFYLGFNLFTSLADNAITKKDSTIFYEKVKCYRDSALFYSGGDIVLESEKMRDEGNLDKAIEIISKNLPDNLTTNEAGLKYYILSEIYGKKNDLDNQVKYLAMSSVASIHNGIRQYIALRKLAEIMYEMGDIDRAYKYIHQCLGDAKACNSHLRILEASAMLPIIDSAVLHQKQSSRNILIVTVIIITLLSVSLFVMLLLFHKKNRVLDISRQEQAKANNQLKVLNTELRDANEKLTALNSELVKTQFEQKELNDKLSESDKVKTEYITRFMHLCLEYISKMENYRKNLNKIANKRNFDALYETIQSTRYITKEVATFYSNFDEAFLHIYPNFIRNINKLFRPEEQITLKDGDKLTTELRICALMKLGITDGGKIQEFLRCSASTVYNYRTNMRNKAIDRDGFEINVSKL